MTAGVAMGVLTPARQAHALSAGSVAGVVRDSAGTPQIGVAVELLRADSSLVARAFTDDKGSYRFATVMPGHYALKAAAANYIPTLKQNLRIRANTIVNLTLNSLYDLIQWLPEPPRARPQSEDDWAWTLRSAQTRPLLRWLEDGSPMLVYDGSGDMARRMGKTRMRVKAAAGGRRFGAGAGELSVAMQKDTSARRRTVMSAEMAPDAEGLMDAMLGFRQEMTNTGLGSSSVQTLVAMMNDPAAGAAGQQGLEAGVMRTWESVQVLNGLEAEAGSEQVLARLGDGTSSNGLNHGGDVFAALPFASVTVHEGRNAISYRVATSRSTNPGDGEAMPGAWLPLLSERNGELVLEHGLHQEVGWSTYAGPAEMQLVIYRDNIENPVIEGGGRLAAGDAAGGWMLVDGASGLLRAAGPGYSTAGMLATVESRLPGHNRVKLSYASGDALVLHTNMKPVDVATILLGAHSHRTQMYSLALSGTWETTGTHWRASYRRQPGATVTEVAPFAVDASEPYLNVYIRQPIHICGTNREGGGGGLEAQVDMRNLLAEGYQPFLTKDGSHLYFAQAQRSIRGGLAFTF